MQKPLGKNIFVQAKVLSLKNFESNGDELGKEWYDDKSQKRYAFQQMVRNTEIWF